MIKEFKDQDYKIIEDIWERSVEATHDFLSREDFEFYKQMVPGYFPKATIYVLEEEGIIKGFLGISGDNIDMLFVDSQFIGQGCGKKLIQFALDTLQMKKVDVNEQNISAYTFYKNFGFKLVNRSQTDDFGKEYPILHLELKD